jgi:general secretion pathway protein L
MQLSKHALHIKLSAPVSRNLGAFWSWWVGELREMLPPRVRGKLMPRAERVYLELDGSDLIVSQGTAQDKKEASARYSLDHPDAGAVTLSAGDEMHQRARQVVLCLPADKALTRTLTLPLAAEENLREVLSFEMDRQTPFTADQVYYDFSVLARSAAEGTLTVDLVLTTRRTLDDLLVRLGNRGLFPDLVTVEHREAGSFASVNLLPVDRRQRKSVTPWLVNFALGTLAVLLLVSAAALPLLDKKQQIEALEPSLKTASAKAEEARQLRKEVERLTANSRFLTDKKQSSLTVLEIMDELTRILPDDTWITRLDIKGSELQIQGQSSSAAAVIPLIESSSILQNPSFRSPVTQVPRSDDELFHLSAEIRGQTP